MSLHCVKTVTCPQPIRNLTMCYLLLTPFSHPETVSKGYHSVKKMHVTKLSHLQVIPTSAMSLQNVGSPRSALTYIQQVCSGIMGCTSNAGYYLQGADWEQGQPSCLCLLWLAFRAWWALNRERTKCRNVYIYGV